MSNWKKFVIMAVNDGSIGILCFTVSTLLILANFSNELLTITMFYCYLVGFLLSFGVITFRIVLNQYIIMKLRLDKLRNDLMLDNWSDLKADDLKGNLMAIFEPMVKNVVEMVVKKQEDGLLEKPGDITDDDLPASGTESSMPMSLTEG